MQSLTLPVNNLDLQVKNWDLWSAVKFSVFLHQSSKLTFTCSKPSMETLEKGLKYV